MDTIPLISTDTNLFTLVKKLVSSSKSDDYNRASLIDPAHAIDFMSMEMPELAFIDFSDRSFDAFGLLRNIMADPWLFHGGIIALCNDYDCAVRIEKVKGANIVVVIMRDDIKKQLPKIMDIVRGNRRILYQRDVGTDLVWNISGSFKMGNDPQEASCYANLISNFLCTTNRIDQEQKPVLTMSIFEMLMNAIEHGNCGITYEEKSAWMNKGTAIARLIEKKCMNPVVAKRRVIFEYAIQPDCARFFVADQGKGFDWRRQVSGEDGTGVLELHGRGISLARSFTRNLRYNQAGNGVSFEIVYQKEVSAAAPKLFSAIGAKKVRKGQIIFRHGGPSDFLYYIVKGQYDVIVNARVVSTLTPDDMFMGEMSFLLNNRRSATVRAKTPGTLIRISKRDFVQAIRRKPHYALFLSRLLAQRIVRLNERAVSS